MKKLFFAVAAMAAMLTSCSKDDAFGGLSHGKVTFEVSTPELATRADEGKGLNAKNLYYAVYDVTEDPTNGGVMVKTNYATDDATDDVTFAKGSLTTKVTIDLVEGRNYEVAFWAESENSPYVFKYAANQKSVCYEGSTDDLVANNEDYDAFFAYVGKGDVKVGQSVSVTLKRPFAQLNVATNDTDKAKEPLGVEVEQTGITVDAYTSFNLQTGEVNGEKTSLTFGFNDDTKKMNGQIEVGTDTYDWLTMNYILVNERENVDVTFNFSDTKGKADYTRPYAAVPVQRNYRTNVIGSILTDPTDFNVEIKPGVDGTINEERNKRREVATTEEFVDAFGTLTDDDPDNDVDEVVLTGDVVIDENFNWSQFISYDNSPSLSIVTRAGEVNSLNIPAGKTFTLDLNGCTISATENSTGSYGLININPGAELIITDSEGTGAIELTAKQNRGWNAYSSVISNQRGKLTVNGGTIEHLGRTDMAYAIDNLTNTGSEIAETVINGGTVKSTYRAVRQFLNSTKAQNILTVNGGTIEGANKSIWMQNANDKLNPGKLTVAEGASLIGNVYVSYAGSTTGEHIEASVAVSALKNNSEVLLNNAPEGYDVFENNGVWTVGKVATIDAQGVYHISDVAGLQWFAAQVNAGNTFEGKTVVLDADIDLKNEQWIPIGYWQEFKGVFNGNNYTISNLKHHTTEADCYIGLFGCVNNATIKNLTVKNADIKLTVGDDSWAGGHSGAVVGLVVGESAFENISVTGIVKVEGPEKMLGAQRIGAVIGGNDAKYENRVNLTLKDIEVNADDGSYVKGNAQIGGIAGALYGEVAFENCSSNIDVTAELHMAGGIIGLAPFNATFANCITSGDLSVTNGREGNTNDMYRVGSIAGSWDDNTTSTLTLTDCSYTGELSGHGVASFDCGGYVGRGYSAVVGAKITVNGAEYEYLGDGMYTINGVPTVSSAAGLANVVAKGYTTINLADGEYDVSGCAGKTLTLNGSVNAILKLKNEGEDGCDYAFGSSTGVGNVTFNGLTIDTTGNTGNYKGFAYMKGTFNNCNFVGAYSLNNSNDFVFSNCTFNFKNGYFWTWGANSVTFDGCTFNGNSKAILAHGYASTAITINDCTFAATEKGFTGAGDNTACVEIDPAGSNTYTINFTGNNTKTDSYAGWTRVKDASTGHTITGIK